MNRHIVIGSILLVCGCAVGTADEPAKPQAGDDVVARIGDREITEADLKPLAGGALLKLEQQFYDVRMQALDQFLFEYLTEQAAKEADMPRELWLSQNMKVAQPSEDQIEQVLNQFRARLPQDDNQARQQVVNFLRQQSTQQAQAEMLQRLKAEADLQVYLDPPRVEPEETAYSPTRGPADAPVTLVEYTDFQCPYCVRVQPVLDELRERYGESLRHVFKNLPLAMHQQADLAAQAGLCAYEQSADGFWRLHDWMFENRQSLSLESIVGQAGASELDPDALRECLEEGRYSAQVRADAQEANSFGITGTPGFTVNGRVLSGAQPLEAFVQVIDDELERAGLPVPEPPAPENGGEGTQETPATE